MTARDLGLRVAPHASLVPAVRGLRCDAVGCGKPFNRYDSEIDRSRRVLVEFSIAKVNSADRTQHNPGVHTTHHIHIAKLRTSFGVTSFRPFRAPDHTAHCPHMIASAG